MREGLWINRQNNWASMILKLWILRLFKYWIRFIYSSYWWAKPWRFPLIRCWPSCGLADSNRCTNPSYISRCNSLLSYSRFRGESWRCSRTTKSVEILCKIPWCVPWSVLRNLWSQPFIDAYCLRSHSSWKCSRNE